MFLQSIIERKHSDIVYKLFGEKVMRVRGADCGVPIPSGEGAMLLPSHQSVHFDTWTVETAAHLLLFLVPWCPVYYSSDNPTLRPLEDIGLTSNISGSARTARQTTP